MCGGLPYSLEVWHLNDLFLDETSLPSPSSGFQTRSAIDRDLMRAMRQTLSLALSSDTACQTGLLVTR